MSPIVSSDPIYTAIVQPTVDRTGIDPRAASLQLATGFLAIVVVSAVVRVATGGPNGDVFTQIMHIVGGVIISWWIGQCVRWGDLARLGPFGMLHAAMRAMFILCALIDIATLVLFAMMDIHIDGIVWLRQGMQTAENVTAGTAMYLGMCRNPPPRDRRPARLSPA